MGWHLLSFQVLIRLPHCQNMIMANTIKSHFYIDNINSRPYFSLNKHEFKHIYTNVYSI